MIVLLHEVIDEFPRWPQYVRAVGQAPVPLDCLRPHPVHQNLRSCPLCDVFDVVPASLPWVGAVEPNLTAPFLYYVDSYAVGQVEGQ